MPAVFSWDSLRPPPSSDLVLVERGGRGSRKGDDRLKKLRDRVVDVDGVVGCEKVDGARYQVLRREPINDVGGRPGVRTVSSI